MEIIICVNSKGMKNEPFFLKYGQLFSGQTI
ncbi:hypothetical protein PI23P_08435 [Polaribacter irgensii 23-P]|uniref:Uncharacterized protein n=1 Tax=Polaribacter irgensii 23-P TaxID=313594 RepID=A4BZP6_9FLAO|nr:hypothetical protein PI23P_08435 [Polaribacter irgensii 23-P]